MIEFVVVNFILLVFVFVWVMKLRDACEGTVWEPFLRVVVGIPALVFDWYVNTFAATVLFLDPPDGWEVVTGRLKRYKKKYGSQAHLKGIKWWRLTIAEFFCNLANKFDVGHC